MKLRILIFFILNLYLANKIEAQNDKSNEFQIYSELYSSKSIHNLSKPNYLCSYNLNNQPSINILMMKLSSNNDFQMKNSLVRYNLGLIIGDYANENLSSESRSLQNIYESNIGIKFSKNMILDAGIFASHIGFESAIGKENWTCTRSILADNTPYYEAGYRLNFISNNKKWKGNLNFINGWQKMTASIKDQTSWGHQIQYTIENKITLNSSSYFGQSPKVQNNVRYFHNFYIQYQPNQKIGIIAGIDNGIENEKNSRLDLSKNYISPILICRYTLNKNSSLCGRFEYFKDQNLILQNTLLKEAKGYSVNYDYNLKKSSLLRLEARYLVHKESENLNANDLKNLFFSVVFCTKINQ